MVSDKNNLGVSALMLAAQTGKLQFLKRFDELADDEHDKIDWSANALLALAKETGVKHAVLDVGVENYPARALYAEMGFQTISRRDRYYRDGQDALIQFLDVQRKSI